MKTNFFHPFISENQAALLQNALAVVNRLPPSRDATNPSQEEQAFKNMWNFNLPDAAYGWVVLDVNQGRVSAETKSQGFNFSYRRSNTQSNPTSSPAMSASGLPTSTSNNSSNTMGTPYPERSNQFRQPDWQQQAAPPMEAKVPSNSDSEWKDNGSSKDEKFTSGSNSARNSKRMSMVSFI